tara:strand:- start:1225 stop:1428 length:204 start_codon:yes stop_codon:yes gene_type:complete
MDMWQWAMLFVAVSLNTLVNCCRLYLEGKRYSSDHASVLVREAINDLVTVGLKSASQEKKKTGDKNV